jgi:hypothetical protein
MRIFFALLLSITLYSSAFAQELTSDTLSHSPRRATLLSVALPGAGQVYNKKAWKVPIVYAGLGLSVYYLDRNLGLIKLYRGDLKALQDDDPNTIPETNFSSSNLNELLNTYKNLRDLSYVSIAAIYALQIIDANVDAHLFNFDVGEDLSMAVLPYSDFTAAPAVGLHLSLKF